jgi:hypothetical protein
MFLKHVGKHGDRKVAIVFKEVPGEDHMALVIYPDVLPTHLHDSLMKAIESTEAQAADNLGEAIHSKLFPDGRPMLTALHTEGMIKKVKTETITVTPTPTTSLRLDELNSMLREMANGAEAIKKMSALDADAGYTGKAKRRDDFGREIGAPKEANVNKNYIAGSDAAKALDNSAIASNLAQQAHRMESEAKMLLAESARLKQEAAELSGQPLENKPKRGRPTKPKTADVS